MLDRSVDGILGIQLKDRFTERIYVMFACYLPPDSSPYGKDSVNFFAYLTSQIFTKSYADLILVCGDLNARVGNKNDINTNLSSETFDIPPRKCLDSTSNKHGSSLIDFLNACGGCMLNGRFTESDDNYTCIKNGKSVVDYIICLQEQFSSYANFKVETPAQLSDKYCAQGLISSKSHLPDHDMLSISLVTCNLPVYEKSLRKVTSKYNFKNIPEQFMNNAIWKQSIKDIISDIEKCTHDQVHIDAIYEEFVDNVHNEMKAFLKKLDCTERPAKRSYKKFKSYWNDELNQYMKGNIIKVPLINISNIKNLSSSSPHNFWKTLHKQTRVARSSVPSMVYDNHANMFLTSDEDAVRDKWKNDFSSLYNAALISPHDEQYTQLINMKEDVEHNMLQHDYNNNIFLNSNISYDEVEKCIERFKPDKASGYDGICNEVLCKPQITYVLYKLFSRIFESGKIPSLWKRCNITPVPKSAMKDTHVPINYRGISLLSCVGKMYSSLLSNRILSYCELCNILVDEQNGFRKNRSCNDHIFILSSIIHNRLNNGKPTFAAFLNMEKAFDKVDRNLLLLRLLQYGIDYKMYYSIKNMYVDIIARVKVNNLLTDWFNVSSGVRQGDNLSPVLFNLYINDLAIEFKKIELWC